MSVELDPTELSFKRPFTQEVAQNLRLSNPNSDPVAFKVKTTAPKQYCVRPNSGRIESGGYVDVQVLLQAMEEDPPLDVRCKDKFLVQSVAVTGEKEWSNLEYGSKTAIQEKKIRVVFLPPDGYLGTHSVNGVDRDQSFASSPAQEPFTPHQPNRVDAPPAYHREREAGQGGSSGIAAVKSTITNAVPTSVEELKAQLSEANNSIQRLKQQAEQGLRQRKAGAGAGDAKSEGGALAGTDPNAPLGVSIQIVAILCLISFLLAYLFF